MHTEKHLESIDPLSSDTLYKQIKKILIKELQSGRFKVMDKFLTDREITERFKVSSSTAKLAVNDLVYLGLLRRRPRQGTFVKSTSPTGLAASDLDPEVISDNIHFILDQSISDGLFNPFYSRVMETFQRIVSEHGFNFGFFLIDQEKKHLEQLFGQLNKVNTRGIVLAGDVDPDLVNRIMDIGKACLLINNSIIEDPSIAHVNLDHFSGAYHAVRHLIARGHTRIAIIGGNEDSVIGRIRLKGYFRAFADKGIAVDPNYVMTFKVCGEGLNTETGFGHMQKLLEARPLPTAVFAINDTTAIAAMTAIQKNGLRIPDDISVIGFDDIEMARFVTPPLTTMRSHREEIARISADLLLRLIAGKLSGTRVRLIEPELVERQSVKGIQP
jgi:LacI family transcriptional regulator